MKKNCQKGLIPFKNKVTTQNLIKLLKISFYGKMKWFQVTPFMKLEGYSHIHLTMFLQDLGLRLHENQSKPYCCWLDSYKWPITLTQWTNIILSSFHKLLWKRCLKTINLWFTYRLHKAWWACNKKKYQRKENVFNCSLSIHSNILKNLRTVPLKQSWYPGKVLSK